MLLGLMDDKSFVFIISVVGNIWNSVFDEVMKAVLVIEEVWLFLYSIIDVLIKVVGIFIFGAT